MSAAEEGDGADQAGLCETGRWAAGCGVKRPVSKVDSQVPERGDRAFEKGLISLRDLSEEVGL